MKRIEGSARMLGRTALILMVLGTGSVVLGQITDKRIPCFVMGDGVYAPFNPFTTLFVQDPLFRYSLFPLPTEYTDEEKKRLDRIYYPRTGKVLAESFQILVFYDFRPTHFTPRQLMDLADALRDEGLTSVTAHSVSWHVWEPTVLLDISPISLYDFHYHEIWRVRLRREREPIFLPFVELGLEKPFGGILARMTPKEGATIWADMVPQGTPWLVSWRPGGGNAGIQWVFGDRFDRLWWGTAPGYRTDNPYSLDFATNLLLYSRDMPIVTEIHARRDARLHLSTFNTRQLLVLSVLSWAEKFGANTLSLTEALKDLEAEVERAIDAYIEQDYSATIDLMERVDPKVSEISNLAGKLKDQALFWVYVSEWLVVTSVALMAGMLLWSLMVKRRAYRPVGGTRVKVSRHA